MDRDAFHRVLRRVRPAIVVHVDDDGRATPIALSRGRGRWETCADAIVDMVRTSGGCAELRDGNGAVIRRVTIDVADDDGRNSDTPPSTRDASMSTGTDVRCLLELMLKAQESAIQRQQEMMRPLIDGYTDLARAHSEYAAQVVELVKLAASAHAAAASVDSAQSSSPQLDAILAAAAQRLSTQ
jgi:hypothetical protein